ncbi:hypothetical protein EF405_12200 [Cyclobacteriaceae bacterium YHN15]|nr:hypothetical protein EF405_12200 [Cyclobacteriaceae bacterium YHN15]
MALSILVGLLDGFGLAMFLPLLEMVEGKVEANSESTGKLSDEGKVLNTFNGEKKEYKSILYFN